MKIYWYQGHKNIVGDRVRMARKYLHLSQSDLAAKLQLESIEVEQKSVSRLELGDRFVSDYEVLVLSKILQVSVSWLLTGEGVETERFCSAAKARKQLKPAVPPQNPGVAAT